MEIRDAYGLALTYIPFVRTDREKFVLHSHHFKSISSQINSFTPDSSPTGSQPATKIQSHTESTHTVTARINCKCRNVFAMNQGISFDMIIWSMYLHHFQSTQSFRFILMEFISFDLFKYRRWLFCNFSPKHPFATSHKRSWLFWHVDKSNLNGAFTFNGLFGKHEWEIIWYLLQTIHIKYELVFPTKE